MQIGYLDGPRLRRSLIAACEHAQLQRAELNRINVFPVPDGDTGTNLALTVRSIADHLRSNSDRAISSVAHEAAQGAILGARGNCGMMLSHFLLGFADSVGGSVRISTAEFGVAMAAGVDKLYASLENPVEGTILSVMRDSASAARASTAEDFVPLVGHVLERARDSLARTPEKLAVLRKAGVVDAGAKGFVSLLEGALNFMEDGGVRTGAAVSEEVTVVAAAAVDYASEGEQYRFCTEALVRGSDLPSQEDVRAQLRDQGDSLIVIRSDDVLKVHVHTDDPESVFAYLRGVGSLVTHKAEDMEAQHATIGQGRDGHVVLARRPLAVVTDSSCDLSEEIVRAHGIHVLPMSLVEGDRTYRDGVDITPEEFHARLGESGPLPTTSQPAPAEFLRAYERASEEGESVIGVFVGSGLSGTFGAAEAAAARAPDPNLHLYDSLSASLLQGLLVLKAAELGELGWSAQRVSDELRRIRSQSGILITVSRFDRLIASGRVDRRRALLGKMLGLKPILGLSLEGRVVGFSKAFGDRRARPALMRVLRESVPEGARQLRFGVVHVGMPEIVDSLSEELRATFGADVEILSAPATPVIATHLGVGAWGVAYMVED